MNINDPALFRLLQLSSVALPVGAYAFSQGLEQAVHKGWIQNLEETQSWLETQMFESLAKTDIPLLLRQCDALTKNDNTGFIYWNNWALACRETEELKLTDTATGAALIKLLKDLDIKQDVVMPQEISFVSAFALAAQHWQIDVNPCAHGYLWSWLENQVAAATKLVPLGQVAAQRLLGRLLGSAEAVLEVAYGIEDGSVGGALPNLAMASSWHESQYSRLFRS